LAKLRVGTDWDSNFWYIKTDIGTIPLNINYNDSKVRPPTRVEYADNLDADSTSDSDNDEDDSYDSAYLISFASDSEEEDLNEVQSEKAFLVHHTDNTNIEVIRSELNTQVEKGGIDNPLRQQLMNLVEEYIDIFGNSYYDLAQTNLVKLHVDTGNANPIIKKPNGHLSYAERDMLRQELQEMLDHGIIVPTTHGPRADGAAVEGWAFPVLYVKKKDGTRRLCVQFQDLNAVTVKDPWPLPLIQDLLESFRDAKVFSALDLLKGFNQIAVDEKSVHKLTMTTQWGCFSYKAMPFGIINGPSTFSRAIYLAIQRFIGQFVATYVDDITIYSEGQEVHLDHLRQVFARLREVNMKLKTTKCEFAKSSVEVLGFRVSNDGIGTQARLLLKFFWGLGTGNRSVILRYRYQFLLCLGWGYR
jgi:hypothetical protein